MTTQQQRRSRRFGSVDQLPSKQWRARYTGPDGRFRTSTHPTSRAASQWLAAEQVALAAGRAPADARAGKATLATYADDWLAARTSLRPRTVELYRSLLKLHVLPALGSVELARLNPALVRRWHAGLVRNGVGAVTAAKSYRLLRTILNGAVEDLAIPANPCVVRGAGAERSPERQAPSVEQVFALAGAVEPRFRVLVLTTAFGSLRFGEAAALRRRSVDLQTGTLIITEAMSELGNGERVFGAAKTEAGRREVSLPAGIVKELSDHLDLYVDEDPGALVFAGVKGAALSRSNFGNTSGWNDAREAVGLPDLHFHDLRHAGATMAASTGASTKELMSRLGHASPRAALRYQHASRERDHAIASALDEMIDSSCHAAVTPTNIGSARRRARSA